MTTREWMPTRYQDEIVPPARATPSDWVVSLPGDAYALAKGDELDTESEPTILKDGDVEMFDWTEKYGTADVTIEADGTWHLDGDEPTASEGASMCVAIAGDWDTLNFSVGALVEAEIENGFDAAESPVTLVFYSWSDQPVRHVFRAGAFHPEGRP